MWAFLGDDVCHAPNQTTAPPVGSLEVDSKHVALYDLNANIRSLLIEPLLNDDRPGQDVSVIAIPSGNRIGEIVNPG